MGDLDAYRPIALEQRDMRMLAYDPPHAKIQGSPGL